MANKKLDKDTQKIVTEGEQLKGLTEHSGWAIARNLLLKRVASYRSIDNLMEIPKDVMLETITSRKLIAAGLIDWLKEVEGIVEQYKGNVPMFEEIINEHILRLED